MDTDLSRLWLFDGLSDEQLDQLADAGDEVAFAEGDVLFHEGDPADSWWVLLDGRLELLRRSGREDAVIAVVDRPGVWAGRFRAWAEDAPYLTTGRGASEGTVLRVPAPALGELVRSWFPFGVHIIQGSFQTVRNMEALSRQRESLVALGTLAAGHAHEMNNPASAAARAAQALQETCDGLLGTLVRLAEGSLTSEQFVAVEALRRDLTVASSYDPIVVSDREDALLEWFEDHDVDNGWRLAAPLAVAGADVAWCERMAEVLHGSTLGPGLDWVAGTLSTTALLSEVQESTSRVSALVGAVRSYSQVDRASVQLIDLREGIDSTLVMLDHKIRHSGVAVVRDDAADVPRVEANAGELNQVWTNLIDNAVDAMADGGTLRISTQVDGDEVVVEIADTGPGMPADVQARAFDPFFTTKEVGKGTGLGLDISRRIVVDRHDGEITIETGPDGTVFRVRLPRHRSS